MGGLIALAFLAGETVAGSDLLHHWLHPDSDSPAHYCVAKVLSKFQELPFAVAVIVIPPGFPAERAPVALPEAAAAPRFLLLPGRAPPRAR